MPIFTKNKALTEVFKKSADILSEYENIPVTKLRQLLDTGKCVLLGNINHKSVRPTIIGQPSRIKINANIGTSPLICTPDTEFEKLAIAEKYGADTVMDLSTGGNIDKIRAEMIARTTLPLGTVPLYAVAERYISKGIHPENLSMEEVFDEVEKQAEEGVDFMTIHTGINEKAIHAAETDRLLGVVSRGGAIISRWITKNKKENPLLTDFDRLLSIAKKYNVTLSLGDGLRPGALQDSGDFAQWSEASILGNQVLQARNAGVSCMVEGPGHVGFAEVESQIKTMKKLIHDAPLYILGPLVIDTAAGYDHIAGAIGASVACVAGADFICYLTPAEHITLPDVKDVMEGVIASRIAAVTADTALGREYAIKSQQRMAIARKNLDWEGMKLNAIAPHAIETRKLNSGKECAMCGEFCSVKMGQKTTT